MPPQRSGRGGCACVCGAGPALSLISRILQHLLLPFPLFFFPVKPRFTGCALPPPALERTALSSQIPVCSPLTHRFQHGLGYRDIKTQHPLVKGGENEPEAVASRSGGSPLPGKIICPNVCSALKYGTAQQKQLGLCAQHNVTMSCLNKKRSFMLSPSIEEIYYENQVTASEHI